MGGGFVSDKIGDCASTAMAALTAVLLQAAKVIEYAKNESKVLRCDDFVLILSLHWDRICI